MVAERPIRRPERDAILQSLAAGVVPRRGLQHVQVGRADEIRAILGDFDRIAAGGAAIRFLIGEYGSGKTFFIHLLRSAAHEKNLVTMHADLTPDRRLHATGGQARALYSELARNVSTRTNPEGGAMAGIVERFISAALQDARNSGTTVDSVIEGRLQSLTEMVGGYEFAEVIGAYWRGHDRGETDLKEGAIRWLRGEYATRTDARRDLAVRTIVDDASVYDHLKILARFVLLSGYAGLVIAFDELVNIYKMSNTQARTSNYEQILRILNDNLQGTVEHMGVLMAGTPEFLTDTRRGLYSYEALQTRLAENAFAASGLKDLSGPVVRLGSLTPEELYVLLTKLRHVQAAGDSSAYLIDDTGLQAFMTHCGRRVGDAYFRTPRNTVKAFVNLLAILEQNPGVTWTALLEGVSVESDGGDADDASLSQDDDSDELTSFRL